MHARAAQVFEQQVVIDAGFVEGVREDGEARRVECSGLYVILAVLAPRNRCSNSLSP
jgi:hypothetical protein